MAEGYSFNPNQEDDHDGGLEVTPVDSVKGTFSRLMQRLRGGDVFDTNPENEDEDEEKKKRRSRIGRLFRSFLGLTVNFQDVEGGTGETPKAAAPNIFGIVTDYSTTETVAPPEQAPANAEPNLQARNAPDLAYEATLHNNEPEPKNTPEAAENASQAQAESDSSPAEQLQDHNAQPQSQAPERVSTVIDRINRGRTVYVTEKPRDVFAYEPKDKEVDVLKQEVKELKKEAEKAPERIIVPKIIEAARRAPEKAPPNPEYSRRSAELKRASVEAPRVITEAIQSNAEALKWQKRVEQEREALHTKLIETAEKLAEAQAEEPQERAIELSHEHKDLDKQAVGAWATLQDTAATTAKANAAAIAKVQADLAEARKVAAEAKASAQKAAAKTDPQGMYRKAIITGATTAVVVIAALIVVLLLQSK